MIAAWMLWAIAVTAIAGVGALALDGALRALGRGTRGVWLGAMLFSIAWPALRVLAVLAPVAPHGALAAVRAPAVLVLAASAPAGRLAAWLAALGPRVSYLLIAGWVAASLLLVARLGHGALVLRRRRSGWTPAVVDGVPVLVAPDAGPALVGVRRPEIVLPAWMLTLDGEQRALVLRHELEHRRAGDVALILAGRALTALMPWNPALWWLARRLALAIEADCDARVLGATPAREQYALLLLTIAEHPARHLVPALVAPTSLLERRIRLMHRTASRRPQLLSLALGAAATVALAAACAAPAPNDTIAPTPATLVVNGAPVTATPAPESTIAPPSPTLVVNGVPVTATPAPNADSATAGKPYVEFTLSKRATALPGNPAPRYPDALRAGKVEGDVLAQYVVNPDGSVDMRSFKVLSATDPAFVVAVRETLAQWKYAPAEVNGHRVRQLIQEPFAFRLSK